MSHMFESGFSVREVPWHGLGQVPTEYPKDFAEAREWAGLNWEPVESPLAVQCGADEQGNPIWVQQDKWKATVRSDSGLVLSPVSRDYPLITHADMDEFSQLLLAQDKGVRIVTGGCLDEGRKVWMLFELGDPIQINRDGNTEIRRLVAITNDHTSSGCMKAFSTNVRIVCWNTFSYADADASANRVLAEIRHSKNWKAQAEAARQVIAGAHKQNDALIDWFQYLAGITVTQAQLKKFTTTLFLPANRHEHSEQVLKNAEQTAMLFAECYESPSCDGIRGTAYGVVQALGEYLDHKRKTASTSADGRRDRITNRTLLGTERLKYNGARVLGEVLGQQLVIGTPRKFAASPELVNA